MTIILAWLLADLLSGIIHWWEDRAMAGASRLKYLNDVRADNERHHRSPGYLTRTSWWENINTTAPGAWIIAVILWIAGAPQILILATFFLSFGNLVHRWAHDPPERVPRIVRLLQKTELFISAKQHAQHHYRNGELVMREDSRIRFCVMSGWLNPVLDRLGIFR